MVALIVIVTRFVVRLCNHLFQAVEEQRIDIPGLYPETAYASRRLVSILFWLLAVMIASPICRAATPMCSRESACWWAW